MFTNLFYSRPKLAKVLMSMMTNPFPTLTLTLTPPEPKPEP